MDALTNQLTNSRSDVAVYQLQKKVFQLNNAQAATEQKIKESAQEFEAVFLGQMVRHMYQGIEVNDVFGGGYAEETFRDLLLDEYGNVLAKAGGIGLADAVQRQLLEAQAVAQ